MFLTPEQTGGPGIWALRQGTRYLAVWSPAKHERLLIDFDIRQLAQALGQPAGETWQGHTQVILIACYDGKLFEWLDKTGGE